MIFSILFIYCDRGDAPPQPGKRSRLQLCNRNPADYWKTIFTLAFQDLSYHQSIYNCWVFALASLSSISVLWQSRLLKGNTEREESTLIQVSLPQVVWRTGKPRWHTLCHSSIPWFLQSCLASVTFQHQAVYPSPNAGCGAHATRLHQCCKGLWYSPISE